MKKFLESFLLRALTALFVYSFFELMFKTSGVLESSPTFLIHFRVSPLVVLIGLVLSGFSGLFFPLWNVGKFLGTNKTNEISAYKDFYKVNYFLLMGGFSGLALWCGSNQMFDVYWWLGSLILFLFISILCNPNFYKNLKK